MNSAERKLNSFIKSLEKSGILDWSKKLQKKFPDAEVYLVGGAVRDAILSPSAFAPRSFNPIAPTDKKSLGAMADRLQCIKDLDFVVRKVSLGDLKKVLSKLGWVEELGKSFGVLKFKPKGLNSDLDIALPRKEVSISQGGYKDFKIKFDKNLNIEQDLLRRDFTINAITILLGEKFEIIDPFNGIQDVKNKKIKCVGDAKERLSEDYTRILRAVRFACQLDFEIVPELKKVIKKLASHLNDFIQTRKVKVRGGYKKIIDYVAPREVVAKELLQAFSEDYLKAIDLYDKLGLFKVLMPEILKMKKCPQPKKYHTEGDVWVHTVMALKNINSKKFVSFEKRINKIFQIQDSKFQIQDKLELILAVLFHDIGKPVVIQVPKKDGVDRIRFNNHDNVGAKLTDKICRRLALSTPEKLGIDYTHVKWLVRKHMLLVYGHPSKLRPNTIEKYFFSDKYPGKNLIKLAWLDMSATITAKGPLKYDLINILLKRIKDMKSLVKTKKAKQSLPEPLLNGVEIMKICKLKPGIEIGKIKDKLREKQLKGEIKGKKEAGEFLKEIKRYKKI